MEESDLLYWIGDWLISLYPKRDYPDNKIFLEYLYCGINRSYEEWQKGNPEDLLTISTQKHYFVVFFKPVSRWKWEWKITSNSENYSRTITIPSAILYCCRKIDYATRQPV